MKKTISRKKLQALKFKATQHLVLGLIMALVATVLVVILKGADHTGSVFYWFMSAIVIYDSIRRLIKYNRIG